MKKVYYLISLMEIVGKKTIEFLIILGYSGIFLFDIFLSSIDLKKNKMDFIKQFYFIGVLSCSLFIASSLFIGMVVGLQCYYIVQNFGTHDLIGQTASLSIVRELGPVVSAILFTGRTGSALTAEICLMKSTDQLAAMEMMGICTIKKIIVPRFWAGLFSLFLLSLIFIVIAILGAYLSAVVYINIDHDIFWNSVRGSINFRLDILNSLIKSVIFGVFIMWVALFQGINGDSTVEGISSSTTNTVVYSIFIILSINFLLTSLMFGWK